MIAFIEVIKKDDRFRGSISSGTGEKSAVIERFSKVKNLISQFI